MKRLGKKPRIAIRSRLPEYCINSVRDSTNSLTLKDYDKHTNRTGAIHRCGRTALDSANPSVDGVKVKYGIAPSAA
jgi:hypothetical protein